MTDKAESANRSAMYELDELDIALAGELELDARQTSVTLAKKLNTSQTTIKRRLQRLLDEGVITFATIAFIPLRMATVNVALKVKPGKAAEIAEYLRDHPNIQRIILTTGRYDMILSMVIKNLRGLIDFFDHHLNKNQVPHLLSAEKMIVIESTKMSWKYLNDNADPFHRPPKRELDELDLKLIRELESNPRKSFKELGDNLGVNPRLAGKRIQSLLNDGIIRVVSIAKPSCFGLNLTVFILMKVEPGRYRAVAKELVAEKRVRHINIVTGPFELFVVATFKDMEELTDFLMNRLGAYEGVISHETLIQVGFAKRGYSTLAP